MALQVSSKRSVDLTWGLLQTPFARALMNPTPLSTFSWAVCKTLSCGPPVWVAGKHRVTKQPKGG